MVGRWVSASSASFRCFRATVSSRLILRHLAERLRFLQVLLLGMSGFGDLQEILVGFGVIAVANIGHCLLHTVGQAVGFIVGKADGLVIFNAGLLLIAHERVGIAETELRGYEVGINLERGAIVRERAFEVPCHAQQFSVGILRIGLFGKHDDVAVHGREGLGELPVAGLDVGKIVQRGGKVLVDGERLLHHALRLIVAIFAHQPVAREIEQVLVAGIHLEHVVHGGDAAEEVAFLHFGNPGNHQLLARRKLGREFLGFGASLTHFLGSAAVEGYPCPGDGEVGIFFDSRAPFLVAALKIKILVVGHSLFVKLTSFGGRGGYWQRGGFTLFDVVRIKRRGET